MTIPSTLKPKRIDVPLNDEESEVVYVRVKEAENNALSLWAESFSMSRYDMLRWALRDWYSGGHLKGGDSSG